VYSAKVAIVAEAWAGIGAAIAVRLAREAYIVIVHHHCHAAEASAIVDAIEGFGGMAQAAQADLVDAASVRAMFDEVEADLGGVDVVVIHTHLCELAPLAETDDASFERQVATNLRGSFYCIREAARRVRPGGRIITMSSLAARACWPGEGVYAATRAGVEAMMRVVSRELRGRGICVNTVAPALSGVGHDDITTIIAFLSGPDSAAINGQCIRADHAQRGLFAMTTLTDAQASAIVAASRGKAEALDVPVNIAVLDAGGHLKAFSRMDGAVLGSIELAIGKARTAVLFNLESEGVFEYCKPGAPAFGLENSNGGLVVFAGGQPLRDAEGRVVGAVGVSGGAVPQDRDIAAAGQAAFQPT
jgi:3-oxoacyl-[acyl-carrier protein] reductase